MSQQQGIDWQHMLELAGPYPLEAFHFVREGLSFTAQRVHDDFDALDEHDRHISPQQLCLGLREFAIEKYGLLAGTVLSNWNITRSDDFGRIVFAMIDGGLMSKTPDDSMDDFRGVFDFTEAFDAKSLAARIGNRNN
jgi:uncharacterized repeat protein (TIGR04138 family)